MIKVSVIIVAYGSNKLLISCVDSIPKHKWVEIIVIDNNSLNRGFSKGCNEGAKKAKGDVLFFLNPDCRIAPETIENLLNKLKSDNSIGIIGPQMLDENNVAYLSFTKQPSKSCAFVVYSFLDRIIPNNPCSRRYWYRGQDLELQRQVESISGAAMMMRKKDFEAVGGFNEDMFMYWEDYEICRKVLKQNKRILYYPEVKITHIGAGASENNKLRIKWWFKKSRFVFFKNTYGYIYSILLNLFLLIFESWKVLLVFLFLVVLIRNI